VESYVRQSKEEKNKPQSADESGYYVREDWELEKGSEMPLGGGDLL
jgi:hypothetical protein